MSSYGKTLHCLFSCPLHAQCTYCKVDWRKICSTYHGSTQASYSKMHAAQETPVPSPHENTWNGLISAYVKDGKPFDALSLYIRMQNKENSPPDGRTFVAVLKACGTLQDLENGRRVHAHVTQLGFLHCNKFVTSTLVDMYAKCNSLADAKRVFDMSHSRDVVAWTAIVGAYAEHGYADDALLCFEKMQQTGTFPNAVTYICSLKACTIVQNVAKGQELHGEIERQGLLENDPNVGNSLVGMYAKCGCFSKAHEVFDKLRVRSVVTWTVLIGGYVEYSCDKEALILLESMKDDGVSANSVTFVCGLKACGGLRGLEKGREMHAEIEKRGWFRRDDIGNVLVDMYAKCGSLSEAQKTFDTLPIQNKVSWSTLISGYTENGQADQALDLFKQMRSAGVYPDAVTYLCCLKACGSTGALAQGQDAHAEIERQGLLEAGTVGNALVDMYGKCGSITKAEEVFEGLSARNVVSWNALLSGYVEGGCAMQAIQHFEKMQLEGISPDAVTYVCVLKASGELGFLDKSLEIHAERERKDHFKGNLIIGNALVDMYAGCGFPDKAREVFDRLQDRNVVSWNAMMSGYVEHGDDSEAITCLHQMQSEGVFPDVITYICLLKACSSLGTIELAGEIHEELERRSLLQGNLDVGNTLIDTYAKCGRLKVARHVFNTFSILDSVSWNALIAGYIEHGQDEEAIKCFAQMQSGGFSPDHVTFICILKALGNVGAVAQGEEIHAEIERKGLLEKSVVIGSTLVDMYARCGFVEKAQSVSNKLLSRGVISWTALMSGYAQLGQSQNVFNLFDRMVREKIEPDMVTFVIILGACARSGLFGKSQMYFEAMSEKYGILPHVEHQTCVVGVLGRAGELEKAVVMMRDYSDCQNFVAWHAVLASCRSLGNVKIGKQAFEHALSLYGNDASAYLLMSSILPNHTVEAAPQHANRI